ncbi:MAG: hypothetical protein V4597_17250 [Pseudomonadota bacterium]
MVWTVAIFLACGFALWRGGPIERIVALAFMTAWVSTMLVQDRLHWGNAQWNVLAVDVVLMLGLVYLAMTTGLNWLLFAAAFQILGVVTHIAVIVDHGFLARTYLYGLIIWSYMVIGSLVAGSWIAWRERRGPSTSA